MSASIWDSGGPSVTPGVMVKRQSWQLAAPQSAFTLTEFTYTPGANQLIVIVNGVVQDLSLGDYEETSSNIVTTTFTVGVGERVSIIGLGVE